MELPELIEQAQARSSDNSAAMNEVVRRFDGLAVKTARYITTDRHLQEDLANAARYAVVKAVRRHRRDTGFVSFAATYMRFAALRELRRWTTGTATITMVSIDAEPGVTEIEQALLMEDVIVVGPLGDGNLADAVGCLRADQQELVYLRHVAQLQVQEIAEIEGTTRSAVSHRLATCHRALEAVLAA